MGDPPSYTQINLWAVAVGYACMFALFGFVTDACVTATNIKEFIHNNTNEISAILSRVRFVNFLFICLILVTTNTYLVYQITMKGTQIDLAAQITALVTASVVGVAFILCNDVTFIRIFENTVGYTVLDMIYGGANMYGGMDKVMADFLDMKIDGNTVPWFNRVFKLGFLFTAFRLDNFNDAVAMFQDNGSSEKKTSERPTFYPHLQLCGQRLQNHLCQSKHQCLPELHVQSESQHGDRESC